MARLEAEVIRVIQEWDASVAKALQLPVAFQLILWLKEKANKLRERLLSFKTAARASVSNGGKSPTAMSKRKKVIVETEV